jgi:hypothetical protein
MGMMSIDRRRILMAAWFGLLALFALFATPAAAAESYLTAAGEAARATGRVASEMGCPAEFHTIRITDKEVSILLRSDARSADVDEWKVRQGTRLVFFDFEVVSGPVPRPAPAMVADVASGFFPLEAVALAKTDEIVTRALAYAKLEGPAAVQSIEITRRVHLLPTPAYGAIRWTIYVASPRESATVYADASGAIIGGDLSNTSRARKMHFIDDNAWPKDAALESLTGVIGGKPVVRDITICPKSVQVKADHPSLKETAAGYSWDVSGVTRSPIASLMFPGTADDPAFSLADVDLTKLGAIRDKAKSAWGNSRSTINYMMLRLFSDGPGKPELRWTVHFTDIAETGELALFSNGGSIELTTDATVRAANLPAARRPKRNWLDPKTTREALGVIGEQFGKNARFAELSISRDSMQILAEVPDTPGTMRSYTANDRGITVMTMMMPWESEFRPERLYRMNDLAFFSAETLAALTARTFTRLIIGPDMAVSRYTFSVGQLMTPDGSFMVPSPDGRVTLEIRLESPDGWKGGRVTYSSTGEEIDVVMP